MTELIKENLYEDNPYDLRYHNEEDMLVDAPDKFNQVTTVPYTEKAAVKIREGSTPENPIFDFWIPQGIPQGETT